VSLTWNEAAFLSGSYPRLATATLARLVERGAAALSEDKVAIIPKTSGLDGSYSEVERVVFASLPIGRTPEHMKRLNATATAAFDDTKTHLEEEGLLIPSSKLAGLWLASVMPMALVLLFLAAPRLIMGIQDHKPVGYLLATTIFGGLFGLFLIGVGASRLTRRGENLLDKLKARHSGSRTGSARESAGSSGMAVALFGIAGLAAVGMSDLHDWFPRKNYQTGSGCGSECGTSGGGCSGGDGGGGCGGCGGGGD
jgi:uncharacterized protein (TIGR04222 family)